MGVEQSLFGAGNLPRGSVDEKTYSIAEFVEFLNAGLKATKAKIVGEVGEAKTGPTGHMYFTLKDCSPESAGQKGQGNALMSCIIWASKYRLFGINLEPGMKIVASGNPEVYAPNGRLSFICDTIEMAGEGDLKKQYDLLKKKLEQEGIFDVANKRKIPLYPRKIGVITSKQGAVIHDFLNNIGKFGFDIKMIDSRVEGQGAVEDLLSSIQTFRKKDIDVLVIIRGGGSMESLMCFNNELLVREVVGFPVPVIAGIGHDKDVPLMAMASDVMVSTPTAAANLLNESWNQALLVLERFERKIKQVCDEIKNKYLKIENLIALAMGRFDGMLKMINEKLATFEKIIEINNPERQLKLGYSIAVNKDGKIIKKISDVKAGEQVNVKVSDGVIKTTSN